MTKMLSIISAAGTIYCKLFLKVLIDNLMFDAEFELKKISSCHSAIKLDFVKNLLQYRFPIKQNILISFYSFKTIIALPIMR